MTLRFESSPVNALALSSSCNTCYLYSGSSDGYVNFWEK
ncbi:WD40 repeat domain-containing protein, partial [Mycobacterium kansasii]